MRARSTGYVGLDHAQDVNTRPCKTLYVISFCEITASAQRDEGLIFSVYGLHIGGLY